MKVLQNTKNFCLHYDESILNCTLLGISVFIMKKMDEEINCKRENDYGNWFFHGVEDFWTASYGYDTNCMQWKSTVQMICLILQLISLIFLLNQSEDFFHQKHTWSYVLHNSLQRILFAIIFSNFSTKIYATFFQTSLGHTMNTLFLTSSYYYYHNMSFCNSILQKYNYLSKQNCSFIMYPYIRSRYVIDFFTKTKQKKIM